MNRIYPARKHAVGARIALVVRAMLLGYSGCFLGCADAGLDAQANRLADQLDRLRQGETKIGFYSDGCIGPYLKRLAEVSRQEGLSVQELWIHYADLIDEGSAHIAKIPDLAKVDLHSVHITNEGLANICKNPTIKTLVVCGHQLDDPGVQGLAEASRSLRSLGLHLVWPTPVDEERRSAFIEWLKRMTQLRSLVLGGNWVRPEDLQALREALPETEVARAKYPENVSRALDAAAAAKREE